MSLVAARFKDSDPTSPRITATCDIGTLIRSLMEKLPVDVLYAVDAHEDGKGFSLREIGVVTISVTPFDELEQAQSLPQSDFSLPATRPPVATKDSTTRQPEALASNQTQFDFSPVSTKDDFDFEKPKSQTQLLAERGIEQPVQLVRPPRSNKKNGKVKAPRSQTDDNTPDSQLPNPVSRGKTQVTGFKAASQQEAEAASQFGKS